MSLAQGVAGMNEIGFGLPKPVTGAGGHAVSISHALRRGERVRLLQFSRGFLSSSFTSRRSKKRGCGMTKSLSASGCRERWRTAW